MPEAKKPAIAETRARQFATDEMLAEARECIEHSRQMLVETEALLDPHRSRRHPVPKP